MIPLAMKTLLEDVLPASVRKNRMITDGPYCFLEFGRTDADSLQRLGIRVDKLGPRLVACMWDRKASLEIGGYLVVDNLAMGRPSMGGTRMLPDLTPDIIHNLARGMTLKNAAADLPFGGGKSGIVCPGGMDSRERHRIIREFGRMIRRYKEIYIPGPDVGTNDADMKTMAVENGLNHVVSKPGDMGGNRIDELGGAASGVVVAFKALLEHLPGLRCLPQFRHMKIPAPRDLDILIQGFGAVGAHVARIFHEYDPEQAPVIKGISDADGYLLNPGGLPWQRLFRMWQQSGQVTRAYYRDDIIRGNAPESKATFYSDRADDLLTESAFCLVPASPVSNYLGVGRETSPAMTTDRMGQWRIIVEGANTYSPNPASKSERRQMERRVYRDKGILIATDYLVNSGGVIYAAHERIIPTPHPLLIPNPLLGQSGRIQAWLDHHQKAFETLAEQRRKAAVDKLETVIRRNMKELVDGLCRNADSLPCDIAEKISTQRITAREKSGVASTDITGVPAAAARTKGREGC